MVSRVLIPLRWAALAVCALSACAQEPAPAPSGNKAAGDSVPEIAAAFETARDTLDNIDSPVVWHGVQNEHWLIATAKDGDVLVVSEAGTGRLIRRVGGTGKAAGQLDRPNGVAVLDNLLFVVERDNARLQVFALPTWQSLGTFGQTDLRLPYGITLQRAGSNTYDVFVTDNYEQGEDTIPPDSLLDKRVRRYRVSVHNNNVHAQLTGTFGDTQGAGVLRVVESIAGDPVQDRLLIAEEQEGASMIKAYTKAGRFTGQIIESRFFPNQAEGIVLYECGTESGYWVATDQGMERNTFHVFDRVTLQHVGSFRGAGVLNTDGIALTQRAAPRFPDGAFYAVNNDASVAAFSWAVIAQALGLRKCQAPS
jgi:3-phytase